MLLKIFLKYRKNRIILMNKLFEKTAKIVFVYMLV